MKRITKRTAMNGLGYQPKKKAKRKGMIVGLIITFALLFLFTAGFGLYQLLMPTITLKVHSVTLRQDDPIPKLYITFEYSGLKQVELDENYTTYQLYQDFKSGDGYVLSYDVDTATEGVYDMRILLDSFIKTKFSNEWKSKVRLRIEDGSMTVLNKYGDWEGLRFKTLDGTYARGWYNIGEDTYYFDETGKRVSGVQEIQNSVYCFRDDGRFDPERNKVNPNRPMIAITFDDGPNVHTMRILEVLEQYDSRATFFMVGTNVRYFPEEIRKMVEIGCELGNHTTHHARLSQLSAQEIAEEIQTTDLWLYEVIGQISTLVRPPYGQVNELVQETVQAPLVFWSVDTLDWEVKDKDIVCQYVLDTVQDGDIVLLHDIYGTTADAMIECIPRLIEEGYQLVTVSELAKARGITLEAGEKYYHFRK